MLNPEEKLPLEILKEKYIPLEAFPEKYNISVAKVKKMIDSHKLRYAEFKVPGSVFRTIHVNPEDVFKILDKEDSI